MENDTPQGQAHRPPTNADPKVAVAHVDPCILYVEASEAGDNPSLILCWARSTSEVRKVGGKTHLKLNQVLFLMGDSRPNDEGLTVQEGKPSWHFFAGEAQEVTVESDAAGTQVVLSFYSHSQRKTVRGFLNEIKFIDQDTDWYLEKLIIGKKPKDPAFIKKILEIAPVEWPSLSNALAFLQQNQRPDDGVDAEPNEGELIYKCGEGLYKTGQYESATETLLLSLNQPSVRYQAMNLMGLSFMKCDKLDSAVTHLDLAASELLVMDELKKEIVYNLGLAYEAGNHPYKALEQWKKIYEVDMSYRDVSERVKESYGL